MSLSTSGDVGYSGPATVHNSGALARRSATSLNLRGGINYQMSAAGQLQMVLNTQGKTLIGQGVREPNSTLNLGYRHRLTPRLNVLMNVTDVFDSNKDAGQDRQRHPARKQPAPLWRAADLSNRLGGVTPGGARRPGA